eukprot:TRINITY_DN18521_c0_g1_i1.p1 TRINITY_DN18521_c0_g1~~TRINITY_DN18521_c0_g1_i1.p1  ORF type:complete len:573 (-),score=62.98 TRINITY_DN18521_c0_g1_i1:8-1660(-)
MIIYNSDKWQLSFLFQVRGSVFPRALVWAVPSTALAVVLHFFIEKDYDISLSQFATYNFVSAFLLVFRTQLAYSRFWEAASIVQQVRGNWFNAVSSCCAFCSQDPKHAEGVYRFKHSLVRLVSLLYCASLQQVAVCQDEAFEIIELEGFDTELLKYLAEAPEKTLVILQWIQQLVVQNHRIGVLDVAAPILTRVFQDLSSGIVGVVDAQKITDVLFPFPYAQMVTVLLVLASIITPIALAVSMESVVWCASLNFLSVLSLWCVNYIAAEIEMPFGEDLNDLPLAGVQISLNRALMALLDDDFTTCPEFEITAYTSQCKTIPCPFYLITEVQHHVFAPTHPKVKKMTKNSRNAIVKGMPDPDDSKLAQAVVHNFRMSQFGQQEASVRRSTFPIQIKLDTADQNSVSSKDTDTAQRSCKRDALDSAEEGSTTDMQAATPEASLKALLQHTGREIEGQLAELSGRMQRHFATAFANLEFIHTHQDDSKVEIDSLLKVSRIVDSHLALMVKELDRIASDCVSPSEPRARHFPELGEPCPPTPHARRPLSRLLEV